MLHSVYTKPQLCMLSMSKHRVEVVLFTKSPVILHTQRALNVPSSLDSDEQTCCTPRCAYLAAIQVNDDQGDHAVFKICDNAQVNSDMPSPMVLS